MFDSHIHSSFSGDSDMPAEKACEKAISLGLDGIAFTDHLDYDYPGYDETFNIDFDTYNTYINVLKGTYKDRLKILKGIEVGIQPHVIDKTFATVKKYDFDYIIASVHIINRKDPYTGEFYTGKTKAQAYSEYLAEILFMLNNYNYFDVLGHLDYITRYGCYDDRTLYYDDMPDLIDSILKKLVQLGKGMEINTSSYRDTDGVSTPKYDVKILKRYKELGGEIICIGSDAHSEEYIGYKFEYFKDILINAGFKYTVNFINRNTIFEKII